jgi:hypothetical protein
MGICVRTPVSIDDDAGAIENIEPAFLYEDDRGPVLEGYGGGAASSPGARSPAALDKRARRDTYILWSYLNPSEKTKCDNMADNMAMEPQFNCVLQGSAPCRPGLAASCYWPMAARTLVNGSS